MPGFAAPALRVTAMGMWVSEAGESAPRFGLPLSPAPFLGMLTAFLIGRMQYL